MIKLHYVTFCRFCFFQTAVIFLVQGRGIWDLRNDPERTDQDPPEGEIRQSDKQALPARKRRYRRSVSMLLHFFRRFK